MNCVVIATQQNLQALVRLSAEIAARQTKPVPGALIVIKPTSLDAGMLEGLVRNLGRFFERREVVSSRVGSSLSQDAKVSTLFAVFCLQRYASFPGPWLVLDDGATVRLDNPLSQIKDAHAKDGCVCSGRAMTDRGGRIPVGPVVVGWEWRFAKQMGTPSGESWRARARYIFGRNTFYQVPGDSYPFGLVTDQGQEQAKALSNPAIELGRGLESTQPAPVVMDTVEKETGIETVQPEEFARAKENLEEGKEDTAVASIDAGPAPEYDYDSMSDDELRELYHVRKGRRPVPHMNRANLVKACKNHDAR